MRRRKLLALGGVTFTTGIAGCNFGDSGDDPAENPTGRPGTDDDGRDTQDGRPAVPEQPAIDAEPFQPDEYETTLAFEWHARVFNSVTRENDDRYWSAPEDSHYLVIQVVIENIGEDSVDFQPGSLAVTADEAAGEWTVLTDGSRMEATLEAGGELDGWIAYTIPAGTNEVTITADPANPVFAATFQQNTDLEIAMDPYQP